MSAPLLGRVLVDSGNIDAAQLDRAIELQQSLGKRLGEILIEMGALTEESLAVGLAQQVGFDLVDPMTVRVEPDLLAKVSREKAQRWLALPLQHTAPQVVRVAMANPFDLDVRRDLEFVLGVGIEPVVCNASLLSEAIRMHYGLERELQSMLQSVKPDDHVVVSTVMNIDLEGIEKRLLEGGARPYVDLFNFLLANAHASRASDIHLDALENAIRVRYRIDGVLRSALKLPKWIEPGLLSRIKVVAHMDLSVHHKPQEGKVRASIGGREKDLRIVTMPSQFGERCVIRILDPEILQLALSDLGLAASQLKDYYRLISQPQGMILITGPTGSGKSTTLYATLARLQSGQMSIVSVEDPVEYTLPGITQVQVDERRGLTFPAAARSLLRQDPNVLVIGEIRDKETAAVAFQAALTGHLVFATLHTTDTVSTITRLRDLGVPMYLVGSTLLGVVAQRLVRRLCPHCREAGEPAPGAWAQLEREPIPLPGAYEPGAGCRECLYTGYRGRIGVYEVLRINEAIRSLIVSGADETAIRRAAEQANLVPLTDQALDKVAAGITGLQEVARHVRTLFSGRTGRPVAAFRPSLEPDEDRTVPTTNPSPEIQLADTDPDLVVDDGCVVPSRTDVEAAEQILVVDDSDEILDLVRYSLEDSGFRVQVAHSGEEGLEVIARQRVTDPIHLVVLDVMMPGMSGFEVCEQLKKDIATAFMPVLILSARGDQAHVKDGFRAGADDYLPKPFDPEELELRICALLRRAYRGMPR